MGKFAWTSWKVSIGVIVIAWSMIDVATANVVSGLSRTGEPLDCSEVTLGLLDCVEAIILHASFLGRATNQAACPCFGSGSGRRCENACSPTATSAI
jgi:hypothetical protein